MMWEKRIVHRGLNAFRVVRGHTQADVELKASMQLLAWDATWNKRLEQQAAAEKRLHIRSERDKQSDVVRRSKVFADESTKDAEAAIEAVRSLLTDALAKNQNFDWTSLENHHGFAKLAPDRPALLRMPTEPSLSDPQFVILPVSPTITFWDWIIPGRRRSKLDDANAANAKLKANVDLRYAKARSEWEVECEKAKRSNIAAEAGYVLRVANWKREGEEFARQQEIQNRDALELHAEYLKKSPQALIRYWHEVLIASRYPDSFPRDCAVSFDPNAGVVVLDYELPNQAAIPTKKQVKYVAAREEFQDVFISDAEAKRLYDEVLYQICLRTLFELFKADDLDAIKSIVFNGWVRSIDRATGADTHPCIMTVHAVKAEFLALNLAQVELKACFRALKGISGARLLDLTPVRPMMTLNKDDKRFVDGYNVAATLDAKTNLAAMDWLDFENLIRELFEKEFKKNGGEVKITQASRDGGVDAIAFDPDPLRGGKIIIQAKRYTHTVGVSAVRDLYGTVHNEGATKGILVTTSDYGPDAYEFVKGKPLTLLSGSELLYLLGTHGYEAKIDVLEARKLLDNAGE